MEVIGLFEERVARGAWKGGDRPMLVVAKHNDGEVGPEIYQGTSCTRPHSRQPIDDPLRWLP